MTVSLRPHHLLCILTHVGKGYSPGFTANMAALIERIANLEEIEIVGGPDDICRPILANKFAHCHRKRVEARDRAACKQLSHVLSVSIGPGLPMKLDGATLRTLRKEFAAMRVRAACKGCRWNAFCGSVANKDYQGTLL